MKYKILFSLLSFLCLSCNGQNNKSVTNIDSKSFSEKLKNNENPQLIDVRTPDEYKVEHLENSENINWNDENFVFNIKKLDQSKPVFLYCKVGGRSGQAAQKLSELGFKEVYNLEGGIMKWDGPKTSSSVSKNIGMTSQDFEKLINSDEKVIINFSAKWCEPCKKMAPYLVKLQKELKANTKLVRLDADQNKTLMDRMKLDGLPVILIYENGKQTWKNIGYLTEEDLKKQL